jgi:hypothetical protein
MTPSGPLAHGVSIRPTWTTKPSPSPGRNALTFGDKEAGGFRGRIAPLRPNLPCPRLRRFTLGQTSPCADLPTRKLREIPIKSRSSHPKAASNVCFRYSHVDHSRAPARCWPRSLPAPFPCMRRAFCSLDPLGLALSHDRPLELRNATQHAKHTPFGTQSSFEKEYMYSLKAHVYSCMRLG